MDTMSTGLVIMIGAVAVVCLVAILAMPFLVWSTHERVKALESSIEDLQANVEAIQAGVSATVGALFNAPAQADPPATSSAK